MQLLRQYLVEAVEALDKKVKFTSTAAERLKKLLTAKNKREVILEMAGDNEIDQPFMDILQVRRGAVLVVRTGLACSSVGQRR